MAIRDFSTFSYFSLHLDNGMEWLMSRSFPLNGSRPNFDKGSQTKQNLEYGIKQYNQNKK